jgi:hypothetical protein
MALALHSVTNRRLRHRFRDATACCARTLIRDADFSIGDWIKETRERIESDFALSNK